MPPLARSAITATSASTSIGIAPTEILKASAPARLMTSSTPLASSATRWCRVSSISSFGCRQPAAEARW
jgi:hypothetical protein